MSQHKPYPLEWPVGKPRTNHPRSSRFRELGFARTRDDLIDELKRFHAGDIVLSTNVTLRMDGIPLAGQRAPQDAGVAVYFSLWNSKKRVYDAYAIACDIYRKVEENMRALVHTIEAMRTIERHGSAQMLEQAMSGFAALPESTEVWWSVLGFTSKPHTFSEVELRWRALVQQHHPDRPGGSQELIAKINKARSDGERELR